MLIIRQYKGRTLGEPNSQGQLTPPRCKRRLCLTFSSVKRKWNLHLNDSTHLNASYATQFECCTSSGGESLAKMVDGGGQICGWNHIVCHILDYGLTVYNALPARVYANYVWKKNEKQKWRRRIIEKLNMLMENSFCLLPLQLCFCWQSYNRNTPMQLYSLIISHKLFVKWKPIAECHLSQGKLLNRNYCIYRPHTHTDCRYLCLVVYCSHNLKRFNLLDFSWLRYLVHNGNQLSSVTSF